MNNMKKTLLCFFFVTLNFNIFAMANSYVGLGSSTHNFLTAQNDEKGGTKVMDFNPTVILGGNLPFFFSGVYFSPAVGFTYFFPEDNTTKTEIFLQYHLNQSITSSFYLHYGFSTYLTQISGEGGTKELNNGNSTATFYVPSEKKTSYTGSLDLASEFIWDSTYTMKWQFSVDRFLSSERRRVSHLLTLNIYL